MNKMDLFNIFCLMIVLIQGVYRWITISIGQENFSQAS